ncbi:MAG: endosialidase [Lachnospiraceae bacterium]|nr:endosialidase [Lachnospiraceae bacterium]
MAVVKELILADEAGKISFGDYTLNKKTKVEDFECGGDVYKVKTFKEITKLEKNGMFTYESVPGTAVFGLTQSEYGMEFVVEGPEDAQITVELQDDTEYKIYLDDTNVGKMKTNLGGKLVLSVELANREQVKVKVVKL